MQFHPGHDAPLRRDSFLAHQGLPVDVGPDLLPLIVRLERLGSIEELARDWKALEASADASYFVSWAWIENWLTTGPAGLDIWVLSARRAGLAVGLGILCRRHRRVAGVHRTESWWLHATGRADLDVIFIEHNDLLVHARDGAAIRRAMLRHWAQAADPVAELNLPGVRETDWRFVAFERLAHRHCARDAFALDSRPADGQPSVSREIDLTTLLSSHTRRLVRRSRKEYEKLGPVEVRVASSSDEALDWHDRMLQLNVARLKSKGSRSNCLSPFFRRFHTRLLERATPGALMVRVRAGEQLIGYIQAFLHAGRAYVYQSGLDFSLQDNNARPGYVGHCLAAQMWAQQGVHVYDFMAGDARYKENLSNRREGLDWVVAHKPHWSYRLEDRWLALRRSPTVQRLKQWWPAR